MLTPGAKVWTFQIRQGVEFHNGATVTADDVMKTMERHSDEKATSGGAWRHEGYRLDAHRRRLFEITLSEANADLPYLMADAHLSIQPGGGIDDPASGIVSGPYKIIVNEPGVRHSSSVSRITGTTAWPFRFVRVLVINDVTARTSALQSGQVQLVNLIEPKVADFLQSRGRA